MPRLIGIFLLFVGCFSLDAAEYYVSSSGNDDWDGLALEYKGGTNGPWLSLEKVNQEMAQLEGDTVLFRRGDRFEGTLEVRGNKICFGAYGEGERPVLSGARMLTGDWSPVEGRPNVYKNQIHSDVKDVTIVLRENRSLPLGRTPNGDILTNDAFYTFKDRVQTALFDPELKNAENLAGSEVVLRKNVWKYSTYQVTSVEGTTVNIINTESVPLKAGDQFLEEAAYYFHKHLNTLDVDGEWFFNADEHILYMYAESKVKTKAIQYSALPFVVDIKNSEAISLQGLRIQMATSAGININSCQNVEVLDCEIVLCGQEGIRLEASVAKIVNNSILDCLNSGIHSTGEGRVVVTRNQLSDIGLIAGRGRGNGIYLLGGNSEASYNRLSRIGYLGIQHLHGNNLIRRNVIDTFNLVTFDGGAIYTHDDQQGSIVEENIIINGLPNSVGLGDTIADMEVPFTTGIQCDRETLNLVVRNNTISFPENNKGPDRGIHINFNSLNNIFQGNTIVVRGAGISTLDRDPYERPPGEASPPSMSGNRFEENIIVRTNPENLIPNYGAFACFSLKETEQCDVENQGEFRNNVCAVPFFGALTIYETHLNCNPGRPEFERWYKTAADWDEARPYASGNLDSPVKVDASSAPDDFIQHYYNDSDDVKSIHLPAGEFSDPHGNSVSGSLSIAPWSSVVLFKK